MPRGKGEKSTTKTGGSGPSDNGGTEVESMMTPAEAPFDDASPPPEPEGTVDSLLSAPANALAAKFGVSFLDLSDTQLEPAAAGYIDEKLARRYGAAPIRFLNNSTLLVAMVDPQNLLALQDLEIITGFAIQPAIASEEDIYGAIAGWMANPVMISRSCKARRFWGSTMATSNVLPSRKRMGAVDR